MVATAGRRRCLLLLLLLLLPDRATAQEAGAATATGGAGDCRSLLLVTWDTTRADHLGAYGCAAARTPTFDGLAARGLLYERAYAAAPITLPSHTTLLTGVYPCAHGVRDNAIFTVAPDARLLSEALQEAGFKTGASVGSFILDPKFGLAQGFDRYASPMAASMGTEWKVVERSAAAVTDAALAFVDGLARGERFFLWVHCYDPHWPHVAPAGAADGLPAAATPYDAEIAECDRQLARLLDHLRAKSLDDGLLTVVTADHGEALGEHGEKTHGVFVYDATMRVPLVVAPPPPGTPAGTRVQVPVASADLVPTLLLRLGLARTAMADAKMAPLPRSDADADPERALYLESFVPYHTHRWHPLRALVWKGMKYVEAPRPELYALADDPGETRDLLAPPSGAAPTSPGSAELAAALPRRLAALLAENPPLHWEATSVVSSADRGKLDALGYTAAAAGDDPFAAGLADPKDRIGDVDAKDAIATLVRDGVAELGLVDALRSGRVASIDAQRRAAAEAKLAQASALLADFAQASPDTFFVDDTIAQIGLALGHHAAAVAPLERCVVARPRDPNLRYNLAAAYHGAKRDDCARREMEKAAWLEPRSLVILRWLLQFSVSARDWPAAAWWAGRLLETPGQEDRALAPLRSAQARIASELAKSGGSPRPPAPVADADLVPEGLRAAAPAAGERH